MRKVLVWNVEELRLLLENEAREEGKTPAPSRKVEVWIYGSRVTEEAAAKVELAIEIEE
jgi:hypothetical protein